MTSSEVQECVHVRQRKGSNGKMPARLWRQCEQRAALSSAVVGSKAGKPLGSSQKQPAAASSALSSRRPIGDPDSSHTTRARRIPPGPVLGLPLVLLDKLLYSF